MGSADSVPIHGVVEDKMEIRVARVADALRLLEIYAPYVRETAVTFECEVPTAEEFKRRIASVLEAYPYLVAVEDGRRSLDLCGSGIS